MECEDAGGDLWDDRQARENAVHSSASDHKGLEPGAGPQGQCDQGILYWTEKPLIIQGKVGVLLDEELTERWRRGWA